VHVISQPPNNHNHQGNLAEDHGDGDERLRSGADRIAGGNAQGLAAPRLVGGCPQRGPGAQEADGGGGEVPGGRREQTDPGQVRGPVAGEAAGGGVRSRPSAGIFQDRGRSSTAVEDTGDQKFYFVHFF